MVEYIFCSCGKVVDEYESKCYWCGKSTEQESWLERFDCPKKQESWVIRFDSRFSEVKDPKIIAETIWMADRPRTWWEWFRHKFLQ